MCYYTQCVFARPGLSRLVLTFRQPEKSAVLQARNEPLRLCDNDYKKRINYATDKKEKYQIADWQIEDHTLRRHR